MNKINNTLESIKDDIREELSNLKKEKNEKQKNTYNKLLKLKNKNGNLTSKEILIDYFNKIKQTSKLNISHNSLLSSKNNLDDNSLEISKISNFDMDELKLDKNINNIDENNKMNKIYQNKTLEENKSQTNKIFKNYLEAKNIPSTISNENNIIYETFKNMLNKNKRSINTNKLNTISNLNNKDEECKLPTARFKTNDSELNNNEIINLLEKEKLTEENNRVINEDNYLENNMKLNNDFNLIEFKRKEEPNNIFKIVDKLEESGIQQIDNNEENNNYATLNNNFNYIETNPQKNEINLINFNTNNSNTNNENYNSTAHYNLSNNINISNINKETKSYIDSTPTETNQNQNQIQNQFILNEIEPEQISIIKDLTNLKDVNTNKSNNIKYNNTNTNPNNNISNNNNNNLFTTSNISNNYNIKYNNNFYKTISHNNSNNILFPQSVLSFSTKKSEHQNFNSHQKVINKLNISKKFEYYKKDFFVLKRKYNALKGKYSMAKKKAEDINLKLYYESHKNDELINQLKNKIKILANQIKSNVNTFDELKQQIDNKNKEIEQKSDIIVKQNDIIKGLINELKRRETNINFRSNNSFNSKSYNNDSVSQSININDMNYDEENDNI